MISGRPAEHIKDQVLLHLALLPSPSLLPTPTKRSLKKCILQVHKPNTLWSKNCLRIQGTYYSCPSWAINIRVWLLTLKKRQRQRNLGWQSAAPCHIWQCCWMHDKPGRLGLRDNARDIYHSPPIQPQQNSILEAYGQCSEADSCELRLAWKRRQMLSWTGHSRPTSSRDTESHLRNSLSNDAHLR